MFVACFRRRLVPKVNIHQFGIEKLANCCTVILPACSSKRANAFEQTIRFFFSSNSLKTLKKKKNNTMLRNDNLSTTCDNHVRKSYVMPRSHRHMLLYRRVIMANTV